jgi:hypothetical protein
MNRMLLEKSINTALLLEQLVAAFPGLEFVIEQTELGLVLVCPEGADQEGARAVIAAHDATQLTKRERSRQTVLQIAASAVGVRVTELTTAQIKAILTCVLYRAGAIDEELKVQPLNTWL